MDEQQQRLRDGQACFDAALKYLALGWSVLALCPHDHVGIGKEHVKNCETPGKRPWHRWAEYQVRLPTEDEVRDWWDRHPNSNVGMALGPVSRMIRVDVEGESGEKALTELAAGDLPETLEFKSGRKAGGRGLLYEIPIGLDVATTYEKPKKNEEVRFQAKGAETVLPPSRHSSGSYYEWEKGRSPFNGQAALAPAWLLQKLENKASGKEHRSPKEWDEIFSGSFEGSRNDNMTAICGRLISGIHDLADSSALQINWQAALAFNERNDPPMDEKEVRSTFLSVLRMEKRKREEQETANLDRFIASEVEKAKPVAEEIKETIVKGASLNGHAKDLPDSHLIIVKSDPVEYRLRMPWWKDSPDLKDGYLSLTAPQILTWSRVCEVAFAKAHKVIDKKAVKRWAAMDGPLQKLVNDALVVERSPESKRKFYVLGYICGILNEARRPRTDDDGKVMKVSGQTPILLDNEVWFKLKSLKRRVRDEKEDFTHQEIMRTLEDYSGFKSGTFQNSRWWHISIDSLKTIAGDCEILIDLSQIDAPIVKAHDARNDVIGNHKIS